MEPEEVEEEEDLDFVPFLREDIPSDDGSSGLTSDYEGAGPASAESPQEEINRDDGSAEVVPSGQTGLPNLGLNLIKGEDEEAICRRTRARVSLQNYSLDELEAFLQESDEDAADGQNVDEEEEYRRFLAAVLTDELPYNTEEVGVADEDENDADFELEIEEALESDPDEPVDSIANEDRPKGGGSHRRPETRQKKWLESSSSCNYQSDLAKGLTKAALLRPLVPCVPPGRVTVAYVPTVPVHVFGFTAQQVGQLYVMLHEHVQLLVQVFSVSVMDPERQQVAAQTQNLLKEMVAKREEALTGKTVALPGSCFIAQHLYSSVSCIANGRPKSAPWMPLIDGPIFSVLDVLPLRHAKDYLEDVTASVIRYRRSHLESTTDSYTMKEPLFPLPANRNTQIADNGSNISSSTDKGQQQPKKTLAATLVEGSMKQTVALVPAHIAKLARRFYSHFNLEMLPHKPPVSAVANRVLFTDAEDRLLAMGLMDYNNDWEAIQRHYLPCKSKHQIFVRQKNRSSSKAPDNPIKAVRRMKTSPLGPDEIKQIQEGLKLYKNDWSLVWKLVVPHRDPSLLPRQWRVAMGTQKSYAKSEVIREKRRKYEAKRRRNRALMADLKDENEVDEGLNGEYENDNNGYDEEAYVHEAFLADHDPNSSTIPPQGTNHSISNPSNDSQSSAPPNSRLSKQYSSATASAYLPLPNRRKKGYRVVKLAPDLPPVNLPPSVRVISRARFNISQTPAIKDTSSSKVEPPKQLDLFPDSTQNNNFQNETDFQMHPLLFQMTPDQQLSLYRPIPACPMNDCSTSGFRGFGKEISGDSGGLAFHPLLQRISTDEGLDSQRNGGGERQRVHNNLDLNIRLYSSPCGISNSPLIESVDPNVGAHLEAANAFSLAQGTMEQAAEDQNGIGYQHTGALMVNEDSIQGIVMEQEELSDSDDGGDDSENVEFEREEMADSDDDQLLVVQSLVAVSEKNHPLEQRNSSLPLQELNQANSRGPKRKKEIRRDGSMQNGTELRSGKVRGKGVHVDTQLDAETSNKPITVPRKPRKRSMLK